MIPSVPIPSRISVTSDVTVKIVDKNNINRYGIVDFIKKIFFTITKREMHSINDKLAILYLLLLQSRSILKIY